MMCVSKQESAGSEDQRDSVLTSKCSYKFLLVSVTVARPGRHSSPGEERLNTEMLLPLKTSLKAALNFTAPAVAFFLTVVSVQFSCRLSWPFVSVEAIYLSPIEDRENFQSKEKTASACLRLQTSMVRDRRWVVC